ncbi:acyltransferase family protein [Metabacillus indicus]|uniref:acyltransferase family protein n=1 Tax=Metabacillus indicus TaxID=246786 RepID=UPI0004937606|nr:acyltransferase family protein [Metabacillus indicus]KEZ48839.1 acyltransferase [Metabacillus indicus LMG 22858]
MDLYKRSDRKFRSEIEGLRAVAAFLVAVYHIWLGNVSGGVDVFFVVSGFLITTSLLHKYERSGKVDAAGFLLNLSNRLFPAAFTVLFAVVIASYFLTPELQWVQTISEVVAAALYFENWQLAFNSVDYLAQNNEASPVQHFWAMSIQGQFYVIWPVLLFSSVILAKYVFKKSVRALFLALLTAVFVLSFSYSVYLTDVNQPWAYFDTFTRVWEFSMGGILALVISNVKVKKQTGLVMGWAGLAGLVSCGIVLQVSSVFPGYAALWPTLCAVFILLAGNRGGDFGVHRLLSSKPLVKFGGISYGFYLWHWPLLIFYFQATGHETASFLDGAIIILLAACLAYLTIRFVEKPLRNKEWLNTKPKLAAASLSLAVPVLAAAGVWLFAVQQLQPSAGADRDYPGPAALASSAELNDVPVKPALVEAREDLPTSYSEGCHQGQYDSEVIECEYGDTEDFKYTVALVGGSHSAHWLPALVAFAEEEQIRILNYTKSGCRFSTGPYNSINDKVEASCSEWNDKLVDVLTRQKPDLVFTTANATEWEGIPEGYIEKWSELKEEKIEIFAIRDNPRFQFDVPSCVEANGADSADCMVERENILPHDLWDESMVPDNVHYADLNDYFCDDDFCRPVVGNILVYRDKHHITATYSRLLGPMLQKELLPVLDE